MLQKLQEIAEELSHYKRNKEELIAYYIDKRLDLSLQVYYKELTESIEYLTRKNGLKVLKKINKEFTSNEEG